MALKRSEPEGVRDERIVAIENAVPRYTAKPDFIREISRLWQESHDKFLAIGRHLENARNVLPHGEFERMITHELPFGKSVAYKLRRVAEAIDSGVLPLQQLPRDYNTIYLLTSLSDAERETALRQNLVRPDVRRAEIDSFRRSVRAKADPTTRGSRPGAQALVKERDQLLAQREQIERRLREIDEALNSGQKTIDIGADQYSVSPA